MAQQDALWGNTNIWPGKRCACTVWMGYLGVVPHLRHPVERRRYVDSIEIVAGALDDLQDALHPCSFYNLHTNERSEWDGTCVLRFMRLVKRSTCTHYHDLQSLAQYFRS